MPPPIPPKKIYINTLLLLSALVTLFHALILLRFIPFEITWGGKLKTVEEMYVFETLSIGVNVFFMFILLQKGEYIRYVMGRKTVNIILWIFFGVFALNTLEAISIVHLANLFNSSNSY